ncbi:MAG TPA: methyltransferase domain-containing protein [Steroidobacteraceae bacterium]
MIPEDSLAAQGTGQGAAGLAPVADLLACPICRAGLRIESNSLQCNGCGARFGMDDGVPMLAVQGTSETWGAPQQVEQSTAYQGEYQKVEKAAAYNLHYQQRLLKRLTTRREYSLIGRHMRAVGHSRVILELPCGGGRMTPAFAGSTDFVIEADIAIGQIHYGRATSTLATPRAWMTASAFHIPLSDDSVDGTVCIRLAHHLPTPAERDRLFHELLRVSRRFVIVTYFDHHSLKNLTHRMRHPLRRKPPKLTMTNARVAELARECGGRLVAAPAVFLISSGHRYALIVKNGAVR